jgi:phosphatidylserine decarboxylase
MSQALKDHIWTQLGLYYTVKQIYDKHKAIWWARINAGEAMIRDDFIRQQDIAYLDRKHKKGSWRLHQNPAISLRTWAFSHPDDMFYFQDANEDNGIHVPFTIGIQTPSQSQAIVSLGDNGAISMDATFDTNDVKFRLFTLIVFDAHRTRVPIAWIITSRQIGDDLVEWLIPLKTKFLRKNPKWKPSCFIVDDAPQEL